MNRPGSGVSERVVSGAYLLSPRFVLCSLFLLFLPSVKAAGGQVAVAMSSQLVLEASGSEEEKVRCCVV